MDGSVGQETVVLGQKAVQAGDENLATGFWGRKLGSALGQEQGFWGKLGSKGRSTCSWRVLSGAKQLFPGGRRIYCKSVKSWKETGPRAGVGRSGEGGGGRCRFPEETVASWPGLVGS